MYSFSAAKKSKKIHISKYLPENFTFRLEIKVQTDTKYTIGTAVSVDLVDTCANRSLDGAILVEGLHEAEVNVPLLCEVDASTYTPAVRVGGEREVVHVSIRETIVGGLPAAREGDELADVILYASGDLPGIIIDLVLLVAILSS